MTPDNYNVARQIVEIMKKSGQEVPKELINMGRGEEYVIV